MLTLKQRTLVQSLALSPKLNENSFRLKLSKYPRILETFDRLEGENFAHRKHVLLTGQLHGDCRYCGKPTTWQRGGKAYNVVCHRSCSGANARSFKRSCVKCEKKFISGDGKAEICKPCKKLVSTLCTCGCQTPIKVPTWKVRDGVAFAPGGHWLRGRTYEEIYGGKKPACGFKKGGYNPSQDPRLIDKILKARYARKTVTVAGKTFSVQGYEDRALKWMQKNGVDVRKLTNDFTVYPVFSYQISNQHRYFPDFICKDKKVVYEIKSTHTLFGKREYFFKMRMKAHSVLSCGYKLRVLLGYGKRQDFTLIPAHDFLLPYNQFVSKYGA